MKHIKHRGLTVLSTVLLLLSSCTTEQKSVSCFIYNGSDTFITELSSWLDIDFADVSFVREDSKESQVLQNEQILERLRKEKDSCLLVNMVDRFAASAIIEKSSASSVPLIFFNREPLEEDILGKEHVYYVGTSAELAGQYQAEMAADLFGDPKSLNPKYDKNGDGIINLVIIKGEKGHQDAELRTKYEIQRLKELGYQVDIMGIRSADWKRDEGEVVMKQFYEEFGDEIELVLSNNDDMALGAIDYLLEQKIFASDVENTKQPFPVFGVDATDVGRDAIRKGLLSGTVLNDAKSQADAIYRLYQYETENKDFRDFPYTFVKNNRIYIDEKKITAKDL